MNISVSYTPTFERQFKRYKKKFPSIEPELKTFIADIGKLPKINQEADFKIQISGKIKEHRQKWRIQNNNFRSPCF